MKLSIPRLARFRPLLFAPWHFLWPSARRAKRRSDYANGYNATGGLLFSLRTFNQDSSLISTQGWDDVTGVGTVTKGYIAAVGR